MRTGSLVLLLLALLLTPAYAHAPHPKAKQAKKMTLTVSVKGRGSVTSTPKGIRCPHTCTLAARRDRSNGDARSAELLHLAAHGRRHDLRLHRRADARVGHRQLRPRRPEPVERRGLRDPDDPERRDHDAELRLHASVARRRRQP